MTTNQKDIDIVSEYCASLVDIINTKYVHEKFYNSEAHYILALKALARERNILKNNKTAVICWDLSQNALGRAKVLYDLYSDFDNKCTIVGFKLGSQKDIWPPLASYSDKIVKLHCESDLVNSSLIKNILNFVIDNPYSVVHLSKPRINNILLGFFYKLIWDSKVILDVDDEELSFVRASEKTSLLEIMFTDSSNNITEKSIKSGFWTKIAVGLANVFDMTTVSNIVLKKRYGGILIPHLRDSKKFTNSLDKKKYNRKKLGLSNSEIVFIFLGTPRKHKQLYRSALALSTLERNDITLLIVGGLIDPLLKEELLKLNHISFVFKESISIDDTPDYLSVADATLLLQDNDSLISASQLPAKMIDAIAMGIKVFANFAEPYAHFIEHKIVEEVREDNIVFKLAAYLKGNEFLPNQSSIDFFNKNLSISSFEEVVDSLVSLDDTNLMNESLFNTLFHIESVNFTTRFIKASVFSIIVNK